MRDDYSLFFEIEILKSIIKKMAVVVEAMAMADGPDLIEESRKILDLPEVKAVLKSISDAH